MRLKALLAALALILFLVAPAPAADATGGGQVADCSFATLRADLQAGGTWFYAPHQCTAPILFATTVSISRNATLTARGRGISLSGGDEQRLFHVTGGTLSLVGLTIRDGYAGSGNGGAILVGRRGTLRVVDSILRNNSTGSGATGIGYDGGDGGAGGAIASEGGSVMVVGSSLSANSTGGGGNAEVSSGNGGAGGAISIDGGTLSIAASALTGNHTGPGGDGGDGEGGDTGGDGGAGGSGGAIANRGGVVIVSGSTLSDNYTGDGGKGGADSCTPQPPSAGDGGAGGAIANTGGSLTIVNSTLQGNHTGSGGAGGAAAADCDHYGGGSDGLGGDGGAVSTGAGAKGHGTATLVNVTLSGNTVGAGGANGAIAAQDSAAFLANTLAIGDSLPEIGGSITDRGGNVVGLGRHTLAQILETDGRGRPLLADNGGPTRTLALVPDSPAIGAGLGDICRRSPVGGLDQRGSRRPATGNCDSGAYQH